MAAQRNIYYLWITLLIHVLQGVFALASAPAAMRLTKSYINKSIMADADVRLESAMLSAIVNDTSEDHEESMKAFGEKRKPNFTGK